MNRFLFVLNVVLVQNALPALLLKFMMKQRILANAMQINICLKLVILILALIASLLMKIVKNVTKKMARLFALVVRAPFHGIH